MNNIEKDIPKYKKKKNSSKSQANIKANHKHEYEECLFESGLSYNSTWIHRGTYCKICGKVGRKALPDTEMPKELPGYRRMLTSEEILEKHKHLKLFKLSDWFTKFVEVTKE